MNIKFKKTKYLKSRAITTLGVEKINNEQLIERQKIVELAIQDLERYLNDNETQRKICTDLKIIRKSIDLKDEFLHNSLSFFQFPRIAIELLYKTLLEEDEIEEEDEDDEDEDAGQQFSVNSASILYCIANLLGFSDFQGYFIENNIIQSAINLISHENSDIARESLHITSELMEYIIKKDISIDDYDGFLDHISSNISLSFKSAEYAIKIYSLIAKYAPNKQILSTVIPDLIHIFQQYTDNKLIVEKKKNDKITNSNKKMFFSDFDGLYDSSYDAIKMYIIQTIYYIIKSDFSYYFQIRSLSNPNTSEPDLNFFEFLFYSVNGLSTTLTDPILVKYIFKTLLLIIYNDEEEATHLVSYIGNLYKIDDVGDIRFNFEIYYFFIKNSEFIIVNPLTEIIIFNLFHFPDSFYDFCCNELVLERFFTDMIRYSPYLVNSIYLSFFKTMVEHQDSKNVIKYLIDNFFVDEASFFMNSDDFEAVANYLIITNKIIEYSILLDDDDEILSEIIDNPIITENIDKILEEYPNYLIDHESYQNEDLSTNQIEQIQCSLEISQKIKNACIQAEMEDE